MLKQSSSRMKKVLAILLAVLFVVSVTAVAASADRGTVVNMVAMVNMDIWSAGGDSENGDFDRGSHGAHGDFGRGTHGNG